MLAGRSVLLVADSVYLRQMLCAAFESAGFSVCSKAEDGAEAIELAGIHRPDLIVLDLSMPVMNGLQAAPELRVMLPNTPIILFTMHANSLLLKDALAAGISSVVEKPDIDALISEAHSHLEGTEGLRRAAAFGE